MGTLKNLKFTQDDFELNIPQWEFSDNNISCVWGESGSGKTTLLWVMAGLFEVRGYSLVLNGEELCNVSASKRNIGFVFQDYALFPHLSVRENILFPARAQKVNEILWKENFQKLVAKLNLATLLEKKSHVLSGGEAQRVALVRALLLKPKLILLDEPFSALDEQNKMEARSLVKELNEEYKIPFILVTHDPRDVRELADRVLVLSQGKAVKQGRVEDVL